MMNFGSELRSQRNVTIQGRCANNLRTGVRSDLVPLKPTYFAKLQGAGHAEQHNGNVAILTDQRWTSECSAISVADPPPRAGHQIQYTDAEPEASLNIFHLFGLDARFSRYPGHQGSKLNEQLALRRTRLQIFIAAEGGAVGNSGVQHSATSHGFSKLVSPSPGRIQRNDEGEYYRDADAYQDVDSAPKTVGQRMVAMAGDDNYCDRRQQRNVPASADGMVAAEPARSSNHQIGCHRNTEVMLLHNEDQARSGANQSAKTSFDSPLADIALVLQTANDDQYGDRSPFAVRQTDRHRKQDRRQDAKPDPRRVDEPGVPISEIRGKYVTKCGARHGRSGV